MKFSHLSSDKNQQLNTKKHGGVWTKLMGYCLMGHFGCLLFDCRVCWDGIIIWSCNKCLSHPLCPIPVLCSRIKCFCRKTRTVHAYSKWSSRSNRNQPTLAQLAKCWWSGDSQFEGRFYNFTNSQIYRSWPSNISNNIKQVRYQPNAPFVLQGISCFVEGGHKIGLVGRTGSGKTTLISSLFRMVEPTEGKIIIDGLNISTIGLHDLRSIPSWHHSTRSNTF